MGLADPHVGGVGRRQNAYQPSASLGRRVADWMLDVRFFHFLPAVARRGAVHCISGRMAASSPTLPESESVRLSGRHAKQVTKRMALLDGQIGPVGGFKRSTQQAHSVSPLV